MTVVVSSLPIVHIPESNALYIVVGGVMENSFRKNNAAFSSYLTRTDLMIRSKIIPYWVKNIERFFSRSYYGIYYDNHFINRVDEQYERGSTVRTHQIKKSLYYQREGEYYTLRIKRTHAWSDGQDYFMMLRKGSKKHDFPGYDPGRDRRVDYRPGHEWKGYTNIQWIIWDNVFREYVNGVNEDIIRYCLTLPNVKAGDIFPHATQIDKNVKAWLGEKSYFYQGKVIDLSFPTQKRYPGGRVR